MWANWVAVVIVAICLVALVILIFVAICFLCKVHRPSDVKLYRRLSGGKWRYIPPYDMAPGTNLSFNTWTNGEWVKFFPLKEEKKEPEDEDYS